MLLRVQKTCQSSTFLAYYMDKRNVHVKNAEEAIICITYYKRADQHIRKANVFCCRSFSAQQTE